MPAQFLPAWAKYAGNPVLNRGAAGAWDSSSVSLPSVLLGPRGYEMWYTGVASYPVVYAVGHATSPDGLTWSKDPHNPVLQRSVAGSWDSALAIAPAVMPSAGRYRMWDTGRDDANVNRIGMVQFSWAIARRVYLPLAIRPSG